MVRGLNRVQIIGNLGADPEMRYTPSGTAVTNFRVAVNRVRRGPDGNNIDETEWFRIVAWDSANYKLAEICNEFLRKGRAVYVEGRLQSRKYNDREGVERTSVEVVATEVIMLDGRGEAGDSSTGGQAYGGGGNRQQAQPQRAGRQNSAVEEDSDSDIDDVPF
jgi:single-strand DNA-binding protein